MGSDGPSDEEASRASGSSQPPYRIRRPYDDGQQRGRPSAFEEDASLLPPPPPPPRPLPTTTNGDSSGAPPPPPPPPPPRQHRSHHRSSRRHGDRGKSPRYPTTIEVTAPRSRIANRAKQKIHADYPHSYSRTYGEESDEPSGAAPRSRRREACGDGNYESFPHPSPSSTLLESSFEGSHKASRRRRGSRSRSPIMYDRKLPSLQNNNPRGKVLVHYHPQLGDEGYESTLLDRSPDREEKHGEEGYSRVDRAMTAATRRERGAVSNPGPPKQIRTLTSRGMHTRQIDDVREEELNHSYSGGGGGGRNDEHNNAATRQIRRRVFRVALERGAHDERRRKMVDADMDIGGAGLPRTTTTTTNRATNHEGKEPSTEEADFGGVASPLLSPTSPFSRSEYTSLGHNNSNSGGSSRRSLDEGDMPLSPRMPLGGFGRSPQEDEDDAPMPLLSPPKTPMTPLPDHINPNEDESIDKIDSNTFLSPISPVEKSERSPFSPMSPPTPSARPPSYSTVVRDLIAANEPEKLPQIDRVMEKYAGREEELIKKLDLRYRRKKAKKEMMLKDQMGVGRSKSKESKESASVGNYSRERPPAEKGVGERRPLSPRPKLEEFSPNRPLPGKTIDVMTSPAKITFLKVEATTPGGTVVSTPTKKKSAIMAMQSWDRPEEREEKDWGGVKGRSRDDDDAHGGDRVDQEAPLVMPPPKIMKKALPAMISDSTKTDIHSNALMASMDSEDNAPAKTDAPPKPVLMRSLDSDDNSGMIPLGNDVCKADEGIDDEGMIPNVPHVSSGISTEVENLGNQVMLERLARGKQRAASATSSPSKLKEETKEIAWATSPQKEVVGAVTTPKNSPKTQGVTVPESPSVNDDYKLKSTNSYGDGISVITMETKSTLDRKRNLQRLGDGGEPVYSFDSILKRPPNSITVEDNSGSFERDKEQKQSGKDAEKSPKIQRVAPEAMETEEEKARAAETSAKLDDVEARIQARQKAREERLREEVKKREEEAKRKAESKAKADALMAADDELDSVEALFRAHKARREEGESRGGAPPEEEGAVRSRALMEADDDIQDDEDVQSAEEDVVDRMRASMRADDAIPDEEPLARDPSLSRDLLLRDPSEQKLSYSTLRYPSMKESPQRGEVDDDDEHNMEDMEEVDDEEEQEVEAVDTSMLSEDVAPVDASLMESILSSFDEADREGAFVAGAARPRAFVDESGRQQSEETDVKANTSFVDDDEEALLLVSSSVGRFEPRQQQPTSFLGEKAQQLKSFVARSRPQQQRQASEETELRRNTSAVEEEARRERTFAVDREANFDAGEDNNTISTLGSRSFFDTYVTRSKPQQQHVETYVARSIPQQHQQQQEPMAETKVQRDTSVVDEQKSQRQRTPVMNDEKAQPTKASRDRTQSDAGDDGDGNTISTADPRLSARVAAEKAIAAATRSELQRQREVHEFQRSRGVQSTDQSAANSAEKMSRQSSRQSNSSSNAANEILEEEIARLIAERESRFQAEKAVALMKAKRELEQERRARFEAEAARLRAEEELERLKLEKVEKKEDVVQGSANLPRMTPTNVSMQTDSAASPEVEKERAVQENLERMRPEKTAHPEGTSREFNNAPRSPMTRSVSEATAERLFHAAAPELTKSVHNARMEAEFARLKAEQELERHKLEKMAEEAEFARLKAEEELERLKLEKAAKEAEAARARVEEELNRLKMEKTAAEANVPRSSHYRTPSELSDNTQRLEAEAARLKAERELHRIKLARSMGHQEEEQEEEDVRDAYEREIEWRNSECEDSVEKFRQFYPSSDEEGVDEDGDGDSDSELRSKEAINDPLSDDDFVKTSAYETVEEEEVLARKRQGLFRGEEEESTSKRLGWFSGGEEESTSRRQGWFSGEEDESTSRRQGWFSGEEDESTSKKQGWFSFLRRGEKLHRRDDYIDIDGEAKPNEAVKDVSSDETDRVEELRQSASQMESSYESSKEVNPFAVADQEVEDESSSHPNEESDSHHSSQDQDHSEHYSHLDDASDSKRSSSPELDEPPEISRRSFSDDEGEKNRSGGLFVEEDHAKRVEHDTPSVTMIHAPVGHDFPSMTMDCKPKSSVESDPALEPVLSKDESDDRVVNDEHDLPSTTMNHSPRSPTESEPASESGNDKPASETVEIEPVFEPTSEPAITNAAPDNQPNNKQENEEDEDETQIHHVAKRTFEGDRSKGQLSFTTGSKVEAHSNQRGPWWLGRCGGRTGWFPASAVVPASKFLSSPVISPTSNAADVVDEDEFSMTQLSGDELNAVYDLIRNPSDPLDEDEDGESEGGSSPAKNRWLGGGKTSAASSSRDHSPPPSRLDPSEMAGLSERLYGSHDGDSCSNKNDVSGRASISTEKAAYKGTSVAASHQPQEIDETLSKDKPSKAQPQSAEMSKASAATASPQVEERREEDKINGSPPPSKANADAKTVREWKAARDPNSGLIYYYNTETRETTWTRPPDYVPRQQKPPAKSTPRTTSSNNQAPGSKDKLKSGGRGVLRFLSKMKKAKPEAEKSVQGQKSPGVPTRSIIVPTKTKHSERSIKVESPEEIETQAQTSHHGEEKAKTEAGSKLVAGSDPRLMLAAEDALGLKIAAENEPGLKIASEDVHRFKLTAGDKSRLELAAEDEHGLKLTAGNESGLRLAAEDEHGLKVSAENEPGLKLAAEDESPQKDFWTTLSEDESSSSDESEHSETSEGTQTSLFSKTMIKMTMGKWAGKITERLNSPPAAPYERFVDGTERPQDTPESSAHVPPMEKTSNSAPSNDEPSSKEEVAKAHRIQSEVTKTQVQSEEPTEEVVPKTQTQLKESTEEEAAKTQIQSKEPVEEEVGKTHTHSEDAHEKGVEVESLTTEDKPRKLVDLETNATDHHVTNKDSSEDEKKAGGEETKAGVAKSPDRAIKAAHHVNRKKTQWRSAIDAATGRTYYYVKGTQKVTWEKPADL